MKDITQFSDQELLALGAETGLIQQPQPTTGVAQLSDEDLLRQAQQAGITPVSHPQAPGTAEAFGRGLIQGGKEVVGGILQAGTDIAARAFPESEGVQQFRELVPEAIGRGRQQFEANVGDSTAATIGKFAGQAAPFIAALPAGGVTLAGRVGAGALAGGLAGATEATTEQLTPQQALEERAISGTIGAGLGALAPVALRGGGILARGAAATANKATRNIVGKLTRVNPQAAKDFEDLGIQQSIAAVSDSPVLQLFDRTLSRFPGGSGVVAKNTEKVLDDVSNVVDELGAKRGVTKEEAGILVKRGIEGFSNKFSQTADKLYNRLDKFLPENKAVSINKSLTTLSDEMEGTTLTPGLVGRLQRNEGIKVLEDIAQDSTQGTLPYGALKKYRTLVGKKLNDVALLGGEDRALLKRVYSGLTEDMQDAAIAAGPRATQALDRANNFYRQGASRIEELQKITTKDAEVVFDTILQRAKGGGSRINKVMKSLNNQERDVVRSTVLRKLGEARPGQAGAETTFSARTFLTEYNKLAPEAKKALFGKDNAAFRANLDKLSRVADRITSVDRFANPSGTAQQNLAALFLGGSFLSPLTAIGAALTANVTARLMNNPRFVKWLTKATELKSVTPRSINGTIDKLKEVAQKETSISEDIAQYLGVLTAIQQRE